LYVCMYDQDPLITHQTGSCALRRLCSHRLVSCRHHAAAHAPARGCLTRHPRIHLAPASNASRSSLLADQHGGRGAANGERRRGHRQVRSGGGLPGHAVHAAPRDTGRAGAQEMAALRLRQDAGASCAHPHPSSTLPPQEARFKGGGTCRDDAGKPSHQLSHQPCLAHPAATPRTNLATAWSNPLSRRRLSNPKKIQLSFRAGETQPSPCAPSTTPPAPLRPRR
jgi:hypothetical protein